MIAFGQGNTEPELLVDDHRFVVRGMGHAADFVTLGYHFRSWRRRPYLATLVGPSGRNVLECAPADHAHHLGVWWGHGSVNGVNFAVEHEREGAEHGRIEHVAFDEIVDDAPWFGFDESLEWRDADGSVLLTERRILLGHFADDHWYTVDLDSVFTASVDLTLGETPGWYLPGVRVAEAISGSGSGTVVNARGATGADAVGAPSEWIDSCGRRLGVRDGELVEGVALFDHPENVLHPAPWSAWEAGAYSPLGDALTGSTFGAGESLRLRHRILVHEGDTATADVAGHYARYVDERREVD